MKRYIRTKEGKIYSWLEHDKCWYRKSEATCTINGKPNGEDITNTSDNILNLIQVGDLIEDFDTFIVRVDHLGEHTYADGTRMMFYDLTNSFVDSKHILRLYIKQGNDYILVASRESGEWEVI